MHTPASGSVKVYNAHETARMQELEGVQLAGFWPRAIAFGFDFLLAGLVLMVVVIGIGMILNPGGEHHFEYHAGLPGSHQEGSTENKKAGGVHLELDFFHNWFSVVYLVSFFGLFTYFGNGRTLGKRIMGIRVVSLVHHRISLWHSMERALGYGASALELGFGFLQFFIEPNRRTVHDRIAETIVIKDPAHPKSKQPAPIE